MIFFTNKENNYFFIYAGQPALPCCWPMQAVGYAGRKTYAASGLDYWARPTFCGSELQVGLHDPPCIVIPN